MFGVFQEHFACVIQTKIALYMIYTTLSVDYGYTFWEPVGSISELIANPLVETFSTLID